MREPTLQHRELDSVLSGDLNGKEIQKEGLDVHVELILCRTAETDSKVKQLYSNKSFVRRQQ